MKRQTGSVYFWKYKTDGWLGSEWHFTADQNGCAFMAELFDQMSRSESVYEYTLRLAPVSQDVLDIPDYDSPYKNMIELKFVYSPLQSLFYEWNVVMNNDKVEITIGRAMLNEWLRAVQDIQEGKGAYSIGLNEDHTVFIWSGI